MSFLTKKNIIKLLIIILGINFFCFMGLKRFLLFHTLIEILCVSVAFMITNIIINVEPFDKENSQYILLGVAYAVVGCFDLFHTLVYKGMEIIPSMGANTATQLWVAARYFESISLLVFAINIKKTVKKNFVLPIYILLISITGGLIYLGVFPTCYIEGMGLTSFKKISEYLIIGILIVSIYLIYTKKSQIYYKTYQCLCLSIIFTIYSEICFTLYLGVYDLLNIIGHLLKLTSYYLLYKGIIQVNLLQPYIKLECNEKKYYHLIQILPEAIIIQGDEGIQLINNAGKKIIGLFEDFHNHKVEKLLSIELTEYHDDNFHEYKAKRWDGKNLDIEICFFPFKYQNKEHRMIIIRDIENRKNTERLKEELEAEEKKLHQALEFEKLRSNFFNNISHEFKTPLNVILGITQLLDNEMEHYTYQLGGSNSLNTYIKTIKNNSYRLWRLLDNLIDITKLNSGAFDISFQNHNIVSVIEDVITAVASYLKNTNIRVVFDTDIEEKIIACDIDLIERMILNLISNGIKFSVHNSLIYVRIRDGQDYVTIEVRDNGIGIPDNKIHSIFESFTKVDDSLSRNNEGSGIGLSLVSAAIKMHNGSIKVYSKKGTGTTFTIQLPVKIVDKNISSRAKCLTRQIKRDRVSIEFSDIYSITDSDVG